MWACLDLVHEHIPKDRDDHRISAERIEQDLWKMLKRQEIIEEEAGMGLKTPI